MRITTVFSVVVPLLMSVLVFVSSTACSDESRSQAAAQADSADVYTSRGEVRNISHDPETMVTIAHEEVEGYMPAMTMPFGATEALLEGIEVGDQVRFTFRAPGGGRHDIVSIDKE